MSEFWLRKTRTYMHTFDYDKDGYISEDDFAQMGRVCAENENVNDERKDKLIQGFINVWRQLMQFVDLEKENRLTAEIFAASLQKLHYDPDFMIAFATLIRSFFDVMDTNQDGFLQPEEHKRIFQNLGIPEDTFDRKVAFDALDDDGDGLISIREYVSSFFEFLFSKDENSPKQYFFGPLVD